MATEEKRLPATMIAPETGETLSRGPRPFIATYKGQSLSVDLPGYHPDCASPNVRLHGSRQGSLGWAGAIPAR